MKKILLVSLLLLTGCSAQSSSTVTDNADKLGDYTIVVMKGDGVSEQLYAFYEKDGILYYKPLENTILDEDYNGSYEWKKVDPPTTE